MHQRERMRVVGEGTGGREKVGDDHERGEGGVAVYVCRGMSVVYVSYEGICTRDVGVPTIEYQ